MDESQLYYAKWKKPDSKSYTLYDSVYDILKKSKTIGTENRSVVKDLDHSGSFKILNVVVTTQLYIFVKTLMTIH